MASSDDSEAVAAAAAVLAMLQASNAGKLRRDRLASRLHTQIRLLDPVIDELERQGRLNVTLGRKGGMISLRRPN